MPLHPRRLLVAAVAAAAVASASPAYAADFRPAGYADASVSTAVVTVPMVFPVIGPTSYSDTYLACRSGCARRHFGQDLMGPKMRVAVAVFNGVVHSIKRESYVGEGNYITIKGDNGWSANYIHMNNDSPGTDDGRGTASYFLIPGIREGKRVFGGEMLGWVGDSGNAEGTGPHLHFELRKGDPWSGTVYNAFASLNAARRLAKPTTSGPHVQGVYVKGCATCALWLLDAGKRRLLVPDVAKQLLVNPRTAVVITWNEMASYPVGPPVQLPAARAYKAPDGKLWYVSNGKRHLLPDDAARLALGVATWRIRTMTEAGLRTVPVATAVTPLPTGRLNNGVLLRVPGSTTSWWLIANGQRRLVSDAATLRSWGLVASDSIPLPAEAVEPADVVDPVEGEEPPLVPPLVLPPLGTPLPVKDGAVITTATGGKYVVSKGYKRPFRSWRVFEAYGYSAVLQQSLPAAAFSRLPTGAPMP